MDGNSLRLAIRGPCDVLDMAIAPSHNPLTFFFFSSLNCRPLSKFPLFLLLFLFFVLVAYLSSYLFSLYFYFVCSLLVLIYLLFCCPALHVFVVAQSTRFPLVVANTLPSRFQFYAYRASDQDPRTREIYRHPGVIDGVSSNHIVVPSFAGSYI